MHNLTANVPFLHSSALHAAIQASLGAKFLGISCSWQPNSAPFTWSGTAQSPVKNADTCFLQMDDTASGSDDTTALNLASAHDPVFITADKATIQADGSDAATVTVRAPKQGTAPVTLQYAVNGGAPVDWPIALVNGAGSDTLTALDPATIVVTLKNPANRSADTLIIRSI